MFELSTYWLSHMQPYPSGLPWEDSQCQRWSLRAPSRSSPKLSPPHSACNLLCQLDVALVVFFFWELISIIASRPSKNALTHLPPPYLRRDIASDCLSLFFAPVYWQHNFCTPDILKHLWHAQQLYTYLPRWNGKYLKILPNFWHCLLCAPSALYQRTIKSLLTS